ncbi:hypothetical protein BD779DRAFT_623427 [Infundibulicybe gibba]|nr:hypothetical protein BD779DRAFT_623427 [Infundibulicybe gibba]
MVPFNDRCDVVEFDREESESDLDDGADEGDYGDHQDPDPLFQQRNSPSQENEDNMTEESSYRSIQLSNIGNNASPLMNVNPDTSMTGLVEEMIFASNPARPDSGMATPPRQYDIPTDL